MKFVAKKILRPVEVVRHIGRDYGLNVSYHNAWVGVEKAKKIVYGDQNDSFDSPRAYVDEALKSNPGSCICLEVDQSSRCFRRLFVCFKACIDGFNHCRPLLFLDGTHLKGKFKGHLLSATGKDGNQDRRSLCTTWNTAVCPAIESKLSSLMGEARGMGVVGSYDMTFEVQCVPAVAVDLVDRTCSCRQWQIKGLPCCHAIACVLSDGTRPLACFVDKYFHVTSYASSYAPAIHPVLTANSDGDAVVHDAILPPKTKRMPGRPRKKRIPSKGEYVSSLITCGRCGRLGNHNKKSCNVPL